MEKLPIFQPGSQTYVYGKRGTFGPIAVNKDGEIIFLATSHQVEPSKEGDSVYLYPEKISVGKLRHKSKINYWETSIKEQEKKEIINIEEKKSYDQSLRIKGFGEHLPHVLKRAVKPIIDQKVITYGAFSHIMRSVILCENSEVNVTFNDGKRAKFMDQIKTGYMGTNGDSGSFILTEETFEPVGMLIAGNNIETYHNKLTVISNQMNIFGFFCPISLPNNSPSVLIQIISTIIPDGFFYQKNNLFHKNPDKIIEELGIVNMDKNKNGTYTVRYEDMIISSNPHKPGDEGSFIRHNNRGVGLAIAGNENQTCSIRIDKVLRALDLELITFYKRESYAVIERSGYWNMRCKKCGSTIIPGSKCRFCGGEDYI
jgi:hypothetical protein